MKDRIKHLAEQSGIEYVEQMQGWIAVDGDIEKFAELIVRECLNIMSKTSEEANTRFTYMDDDVPTVVHQMNIEKHFGVKE